MDRLSKSKRIEDVTVLIGTDTHWAAITVLVLLASNITLVVAVRTGGEGFISGMAMFFCGVLSIALIPCLAMAAKLNSPLTLTMLGNAWHPFLWLVVGEYVFFIWKVRGWLTIKRKKGGKLD